MRANPQGRDKSRELNRRFFGPRQQSFTMSSIKSYKTSKFTYDSESKAFITEASSLEWPVSWFPTSILLESQRTGSVELFLLETDEFNPDAFVYRGKNKPELSIKVINS